ASMSLPPPGAVIGRGPRACPPGLHQVPAGPRPLRLVSTTKCLPPTRADTALPYSTSEAVGLKFETLRENPSAWATPAAPSREAATLVLSQREWPASM